MGAELVGAVLGGGSVGAELGLGALNLGSPKSQIMENSCFAPCIACVGDREHQGVNKSIGC